MPPPPDGDSASDQASSWSFRNATGEPVALPALCAIVDVDVAVRAGWQPRDLAEAFLDGGATFLQIRAKHLTSGPFLELCDQVVALAASFRACVVINDRADLARVSKAGGVHVGQDDITPSAVRQLCGDAAIVGYSTHTVEQIRAALDEPASYTAVGPIFGTGTKDTGYAAVGLDLVRAAVRLSGTRPIVAIGGITLENAASVRAAGATSVAVIGALMNGGAPSARVRDFLRAVA